MNETQTHIGGGLWVTAIPVAYPPTALERVKHALGFCKNCWICSDAKTQAHYKAMQEAEIEAAKLNGWDGVPLHK